MSPVEFTDKELVESALQDPEIYCSLVERHGHRIEATIRHAFPELARRDLVVDVAQEAFFRAWENLYKLEDANKFYSWVRKIALNVALEYSHEEQKQQKAKIAASKPETGMASIPENNDAGFDTKALRKAVKNLPKEYREITELRFFDELTYAQIGERLGIAKSTAKTRVIKALKYLEQNAESHPPIQEYKTIKS